MIKTIIKLIILLAIFAAGYSAYHVSPILYSNWDLKNRFRIQIKKAQVYRDAEIRTRLGQDLRELGIPASASAILIRRGEGTMEISLKYKERFEIAFMEELYLIHEFNFNTVVADTF